MPRPHTSAGTPPRPPRARRQGMLAVLACAIAPPLSADGLGDLAHVVHRACECAAVQASGMDAAVRCTGELGEFGRTKVAHRDAWSDAQRRRAADMERVLEACLSGAVDAREARARLGLAPVAPVAPRPLVRWRAVAPGALGVDASRLVRIERADGVSLKGTVEAVGDGALVLRQARSDGGGTEQVPLDAVRAAWVMELPDL